MRTILSRALADLNAHRSVVLVTIVAEQGSAPRGPGSQMLVGADGQLTGTIGGGQVERQSELLALSLLKERRSQIQHFALTQAGADSLGMACGGDVTVLFQFISPEDTLWRSVLEAALARLTAAQPGWLILRPCKCSFVRICSRPGCSALLKFSAELPECLMKKRYAAGNPAQRLTAMRGYANNPSSR